jgi:hypothetical protein
MRSVMIWPLIVCLAFLIETPTAEAARISRRNPFRSYNVHGVNYGSQQWERSRRSAAPKTSNTLRRAKSRRR